MSSFRRQLFLDAPLPVVWELVGDPSQHPRWWPRVVAVDGREFDEGSNYAQVTRKPFGGQFESRIRLERLSELHEIEMSCQQTGARAHWVLTAAKGGTFVDLELGMDPTSAAGRLFDAVAGRPYFRRWSQWSLEGLRNASERHVSSAEDLDQQDPGVGHGPGDREDDSGDHPVEPST